MAERIKLLDSNILLVLCWDITGINVEGLTVGTISGKGDKSKVMSGQTTVIANIEKWSLDGIVVGVPDTSISTTNFCGIYDPEEDSPAIKALCERWKREAECVIEKWEEQEQGDGTKNTKL